MLHPLPRLGSHRMGPAQGGGGPVDVEVLLHIEGGAVVHPSTSKMIGTRHVFSKSWLNK